MSAQLITVILISTSILNLFLGIFVFFKNRRSLTNILFFLFAIGIAGWNFAILNLLSWKSGLFTVKSTFSFAALALASFLLFSIIFPKGNWPKNKLLPFAISFIGIIFFLLPLVNGFIVSDVFVTKNFIMAEYGPFYQLYILFVFLCVILSFAILTKKYIKSISLERLQLKYLALGCALFLIPATITNLILPGIFDIRQYNGLGPSFSLFMVAATTYAIVRYHLMDIWMVVRLGIISTVLVTIISFIYVFIISTIGHAMPHTASHIIYSIIIAAGFIPLKNFIESATDKIFFSKRYKFADVIDEVENIIHQSGLDLDKILENFNSALTDALKIKKAAILILIPKGNFISRQIIGDAMEKIDLKPDNPIIAYFKSHKGHIIDTDTFRPESIKANSNLPEAVEKLKQLGFSFAVPIECKNELIGIHLFDQKLSLDPFTKEDIRLLKHISGEMAFAIENARMFEDLKKLDWEKSEFISVASHQLRTPVSIIKWNLELVFDKKTTTDIREELLKTVYENIDLISQHLDKLMTAFEIEDKKINIDKKEKCLKSLIMEYLKKKEINFKNKNIETEIDFDAELPSLAYDIDKINEILEILMQNAITYTPNGGKIKIGCHKKQINGKIYAIVSVSDMGIGIKNYDSGNIFKKFFRSKEALLVSPNGFGLGLFIAKKFINAHNGDIWFESGGENKGVTFYFSIPIEKQ